MIGLILGLGGGALLFALFGLTARAGHRAGRSGGGCGCGNPSGHCAWCSRTDGLDHTRGFTSRG